MKGALGMGRLALKRLNAEVLEGGAPSLGTLGYERKALGKGISPHGGSVGQPGVGSSNGDFESWLKGGSGDAVSLFVGAL